MSIFDLFKREPHTHEQKVKKLYKAKGSYFISGGEEQLNNIIVSLAEICQYDLSQADYAKYEEILYMYTLSIARKVTAKMPVWRTVISLGVAHSDLFANEEKKLKAVLFSFISYINPKFSLLNSEDRDNFNYSFNVASGKEPIGAYNNLHSRIVKVDIPAGKLEQKTEASRVLKFYFDNQYEFLAYSMQCDANSNVSIIWVNETKYQDLFLKAYHQFGIGNLTAALDLYKQSIEYNPVAIAARFEISQIYVRKGLYKNAIHELGEAYKYLIREKDIAGFYRRYGYIAIELSQPRLASALFQYSLKFEKNKIAEDEIEYIEHHFMKPMNINIEEELNKHKIPLTTIDQSVEEAFQGFSE